jgi:DNA-directed RNA polymerase subunit K/omega
MLTLSANLVRFLSVQESILFLRVLFELMPTIPRARVSSPQKTKRKKTKTLEQESIGTFQVMIGPPRLTRFERARIIGARSLQLALGAPPFIMITNAMHNPIDIAISELNQKVLPINIRRTLPDGQYEDIPLDVLTI